MRLIRCQVEHLEAIREIFNEAIATSTALWEYSPRSAEQIRGWWLHKQQAALPVLGVVDAEERLLGFASYGPFRAFAAYKYTVEHSVYVASFARRQGVGRQLLGALLEEAELGGVHTLVAGIAADNLPSLALHLLYNFEECGTIKEAGFKFGRWIDLSFYQKRLATPAEPKDG